MIKKYAGGSTSPGYSQSLSQFKEKKLYVTKITYLSSGISTAIKC